ncbi:1170_t:CDS:2 [Paraglomus brasilianum]|uniref:1170_t:CDS:1 n=1 Tax=Paraglomus brasilianum TaxID=144538 RepID=A0A9N9AYM2_9GLOM|nr:1170_t:CDS:2 [Paraglomus brasilianum]
MNNENNNNTSLETGINRQFFEEVIQNSNLSSEDKKKIELKLERLKEFEKHETDYLKKKEELKAWTDIFGEKKPLEVQQEIKELEEKNKEIGEELKVEKENHSLTEDQKELEKERQKSAKLEQENNHFKQAAYRILENIRNRRYALSKPIITTEEAQKEIPNLLARAEKKYEDYLQSSSLDKELDFELSEMEEKNTIKKMILSM